MEDSKVEKASEEDDSMGRMTFIRPLREDFWTHGYIKYFKGCLCYLVLALIMHSCCRVTMFHLQKFAVSPILFKSTLPSGLFS